VRNLSLLIILLLTSYAISGCESQSPTSTSEAVEQPIANQTSAPTHAPKVEDQASLLLGLQTAGATTELVDTVIQDFFTPEGSSIKVNGANIQVFEYENAEAMEREASQVAPDGGSVGTSMMMWVDTPHFYKAGRIIVLYIGNNASILKLLDNAIGPQFAGR